MQCSQFIQLLDQGWPDTPKNGPSSDSIVANLLHHRDHCPACQSAYADRQRLLRTLRSRPMPSMRSEFPAQALRAAINHHRETQRQGKRMIGGLALTASLLLGLVLGLANPFKHPIEPTLPVVTLQQGRDTLHLVFTADHSLSNARFTVMLPPHVQIVGYPGVHDLSWRGSLKKGRNLLDLPLVASHSGQGILRAEIRDQNQIRQIRVEIRIQPLPRISNA